MKNNIFKVIRYEILKYIPKTKERRKEKLILALLGSIPYVGPALSTAASIKFDEEFRNKMDNYFKKTDEHEKIFEILGVKYLEQIINRLYKHSNYLTVAPE
jgi:hypothetical protein